MGFRLYDPIAHKFSLRWGARMEQQASGLLEDDLTAEPARDTPMWNFFVSNEQVLRRGLAIGSTLPFSREEALRLGKVINEKAGELQGQIEDELAKRFGATDIEAQTPTALTQNERIIVTFPATSFTLGGRSMSLGLSCTVCENQTSSKNWVRITYYADQPQVSEQLADAFSEVLFTFYTGCARIVNEKNSFTRKFWFNILGAYSTDYAITDMFNIMMRSSDPAAAFEKLRRNDKLAAVQRLFKFARYDDAFELDPDALQQHWLENNSREGAQATRVAPVSVKQNDCVVLMKASMEKKQLDAWGLCHIDDLDPSATPPVREAAAQLTGKLASMLAADI